MKISILGTGAMGSRLANKLIERGFSVTIFNRTKSRALTLIDAGAVFKSTPAEAVENADIVISMLTDDGAARKVWLDEKTGAINGLKSDAIAIESSTLSINCINELAKIFKDMGNEFLDAPVVGSRPQAEAGALVFLLGGSSAAVKFVKPVLSNVSSSFFHLGEVGSATKMKLAVNAFFGVQVSAYSEILGVMQKSSVNFTQVIELFNHLPVTSPVLQVIGNLIAENNFDPLFPIDLVEKDFRYMLEMNETGDDILPVVSAAYNAFKQAIDNGFGELNIAGVSKLYV